MPNTHYIYIYIYIYKKWKLKIIRGQTNQISLAKCILKTITNKRYLKKEDIIVKLYDTKNKKKEEEEGYNN